MNHCLAIAAVLLLSACSAKDNGVRVSQEKAAPAAPARPAAPAMRTEPIFYNGKTYQLKFAPSGGGQYSMALHGMSGKQRKDAVNVATSSLRYFHCKDSQKAVVTEGPVFADAAWRLTARCA